MIRRYIIWRNNHACEERLRRIVAKTNVARCALVVHGGGARMSAHRCVRAAEIRSGWV